MWSMSGRRFVRLVERLPHYRGAVRGAIQVLHQSVNTTPPRADPRVQTDSGTAAGGVARRGGWAGSRDNPDEVILPKEYADRKDVVVVPSTRTALQNSELGQLLSFGQG